MRIAIIHLDLGLGGAERQTIDEALALKAAGHEITIITTFHTRTRCFPETVDPNLLGNCIEVYGDWIPRHIFGLFHALMSIFRMFWACLRLLWSNRHFDIIFLDQVSYVIPLLKFVGHCDKVVFYCHHPDMLLSSRKNISLFKKTYRFFLDWFEQVTTASCDELLVNSQYTKSVVLDTFPMLKDLNYLEPKVVYPAIDTKQFKKLKGYNFEKQKRVTFLSINRYERKKNIDIAIKSLKKLYKQLEVLSKNSKVSVNNVKLIIAGGYDERLAENRDYFHELIDLCKELDLSYQIVTNPQFEPRRSLKYNKNNDNGNNNMAEMNEDDNNSSENEDCDDGNNNEQVSGVNRRKSLTQQVTGMISNTIAKATGVGSNVVGGIEDSSDESSDASNDESSDNDNESDYDYLDDNELNKKQNNNVKNGKRRESSRRAKIDFLDNRKIDKNANVYFITKFPDKEKLALLSESLCVLYTPEREHFGIVPLEAMLAGRPVIAMKSGGPLETIVDGETGFLCEANEEEWCHAMKQFIDDSQLSSKMGKKGRKRVLKNFSRNALINVMDDVSRNVMQKEYDMPPMLKCQSLLFLSILMIVFTFCAPALFVLSRL